jgi:hypothetical protein
MAQQFIEQFTVPGSSPYTYDLENPTDATLVQVQSLAGVPVSGCSVTSGVLTVPSGEAGAILIVVYTATPASSYSGSKAQAARGSIISIGSSPVTIGEVTDVPLNRPKWDTADVTNFQSGSDSEFISTIRKPGTITFKGNRVSSDAGQAAVETAYQSGALSPFTLTLPKTPSQTMSGDKYTFSALIVGSNFDVMVTKQVEFSLELQISGAVTLTPGS